MNSLFRSLRTDNGGLRGLTGSGEPGMHTLLAGTGQEQDASSLKIAGGAGQSSGYTKLAQAHHDVRVRGGNSSAIASGPSAGGGARGGEGGGGRSQAK